MSYNYITDRNSPNYTPASQTRATWGRDRSIEGIVIHWWGDPNTNPSFEGVVDYLCRPNGSSSANYVATGTGRRVACLVSPADSAWASNSANPWTVSIECDPRCRDEDYDVIAELVADIRSAYGDIPLYWHKNFANTACPGNYDVDRIDRMSYLKFSAPIAWGQGGDIAPKAPVTPPAPVVVAPPVPAPVLTAPPVVVVPKPPVAVPVADSKEYLLALENNSLLKQILALLQGLISRFTNIFK